MNRIWDCLVKVKKKNPKTSHKNPYVYGKARTLIIVDQDFNVVDLHTNEMIMNRNIRKQASGFTREDIYMIEFLIDVGPSYATF